MRKPTLWLNGEYRGAVEDSSHAAGRAVECSARSDQQSLIGRTAICAASESVQDRFGPGRARRGGALQLEHYAIHDSPAAGRAVDRAPPVHYHGRRGIVSSGRKTRLKLVDDVF